ncbi:hypothetical protein NHP21005_10340 [Helicobacter sp. NHP21005]|nr:hypothetical protein NHP21005_10340 [Helicobacter sp. NHP21005]
MDASFQVIDPKSQDLKVAKFITKRIYRFFEKVGLECDIPIIPCVILRAWEDCEPMGKNTAKSHCLNLSNTRVTKINSAII